VSIRATGTRTGRRIATGGAERGASRSGAAPAAAAEAALSAAAVCWASATADDAGAVGAADRATATGHRAAPETARAASATILSTAASRRCTVAAIPAYGPAEDAARGGLTAGSGGTAGGVSSSAAVRTRGAGDDVERFTSGDREGGDHAAANATEATRAAVRCVAVAATTAASSRRTDDFDGRRPIGGYDERMRAGGRK
jgi:hypothetical protein